MKPDVLKMFNDAYRSRAPLFGSTPTQVVVRLRSLLPTAAHVLDLGAGDGRDSLYLLQAGFYVTALDLSDSGILALRALAASQDVDARLTALVGDVTSWSVPPNAFDAVIGITVLDHVEEHWHSLLFERIRLAIKPGGYVALEMHSDRDPSVDQREVTISEFAQAVRAFARQNALLLPFLDDWRVLEYSDRIEHDSDHGPPHDHGFCTILARKEQPR